MRASHQFAQITILVVSNVFCFRIGLPLLGQKHGDFAVGDRARRGIYFLYEVSNICAALDHFVGGVVIRPRRVAKQARNLVARSHHFVQHFLILRIRASLKRHKQPPTKVIVLAELHRGKRVRIIRRDVQLSIGAGLMAINVVLRQTIKLLGIGDLNFFLIV